MAKVASGQVVGHSVCGCCGSFNRRQFIEAAGLAALAGGSAIGSLWAADETARRMAGGTKPVIRVAFLRPNEEQYWMGWPGAAYDVKANQAEYTKILTEASGRLNAELQWAAAPIADLDQMQAFVAQCAQDPPDGVILVAANLNTIWPNVLHFIQKRPPRLPAIVFCPQGTAFLGHLQEASVAAKGTRTLVAATPDNEWLGTGLKLLKTVWQMEKTRIAVVKGRKPADVSIDVLGSTLHYIPFTRFSQEYAAVKETNEVRQMAEYYAKHARKVEGMSAADLIDAAKMLPVCRRLIESEGCDGIAVDCLPHVKGRTTPPPCLAFSKLNDEGVPAACQADWPAAFSLRLVWLLLGRPGFMQNICADTVNNRLVGAHCTCPIRLTGPEGPEAPFSLLTHAESNLGVATQVMWPEGEKVTIMKFSDPVWGQPPAAGAPAATSILLGTGRVVKNIDGHLTGGCRTALEVEVDGIDDVRSLTFLHHQLFVLGDHKQTLKSYCELAGIEVQPI